MNTTEITKEKQLETILVLVLACIVIGYLSSLSYFYLIALGLGVIGLFIPFFAKWITFGWFKLSEFIGFFTSKILLSAVFFLVLFPVAALKKLFDKKAPKNAEGSNWVERNHRYTSDDLTNPW